jgi:hypothetical protein
MIEKDENTKTKTADIKNTADIKSIVKEEKELIQENNKLKKLLNKHNLIGGIKTNTKKIRLFFLIFFSSLLFVSPFLISGLYGYINGFDFKFSNATEFPENPETVDQTDYTGSLEVTKPTAGGYA